MTLPKQKLKVLKMMVKTSTSITTRVFMQMMKLARSFNVQRQVRISNQKTYVNESTEL